MLVIPNLESIFLLKQWDSRWLVATWFYKNKFSPCCSQTEVLFTLSTIGIKFSFIFFFPVENTCRPMWFISVFSTSGIARNKSVYAISLHGLKYCISLEKARVMPETQVFQVSIQIMPMILDTPTQWSTLMRDSVLVLYQENIGPWFGVTLKERLT